MSRASEGGEETSSETGNRRSRALMITCACLLPIAMDQSILNIALPDLMRELGATTSQLQLIVGSYLIVVTGLLLAGGALGDRVGRSRTLRWGLLIFGTVSGISAWAPTPEVLIACRAALGASAALVMPATLSIITDLFPDARERGRAIGAWIAVSGGSFAVGPLVGGALLDHFWWGSIFLLNVPVVAVLILLVTQTVPESKDPSPGRIDVTGMILAFAGTSGVTWTIIDAPVRGLDDPMMLTFAGLSALAVVGFVAWELHCDEPMLDLSVLRDPTVAIATSVVAIVGLMLAGLGFTVSLALQFPLGYTAWEAGFRIAPLAAVALLAGPVSARLVETLGAKTVVALGLATIGAGWAALSLVAPQPGYTPILIALLAIGAGQALATSPAMHIGVSALPSAKAGLGGALNSTFRQLGLALGVAVFGSLLSARYQSAMLAEAATSDVAPAMLANARESIGGALEVSREIGGPAGEALAEVARSAFLTAVQTVSYAGVVVTTVTMGIVLWRLPSRQVEYGTSPDPEAVPPTGTSD